MKLVKLVDPKDAPRYHKPCRDKGITRAIDGYFWAAHINKVLRIKKLSLPKVENFRTNLAVSNYRGFMWRLVRYIHENT